MEGLIVWLGHSKNKNVDGELAKILQTTIVLEDQGHFKWLSNKTHDWSQH